MANDNPSFLVCAYKQRHREFSWNEMPRGRSVAADPSRTPLFARKIPMNRELRLAAIVGTALLIYAWQGTVRLRAAGNPPPARVLVTRPVDEKRLVRLAGNTRREANAITDRGRVRNDFLMEHMLLLLKRPPELEQAFEQYIDS